MVRCAVYEICPLVALMLAVVVVVTALVLTAKVAVFLPAGTVTEVGTVAELVSLARVMTNPPTGARESIFTVAKLVAPPFTEVGDRVTDATVGARSVKVPVIV